MEEVKNTKLIGIGNEGIKKLEEVESKIVEKIDTEKININKDVDKDYVRALLDGVDILLLTYNSEDKQALQIVNAIGYMADERRVLSVGLDLSEKENKNEIKINREIKINNDNTDSLLNIIDMIIDSISDECTISIDLTDIKEGLASDKGIKYSYGEFDKNNSVEEIANKLEESAIKTSDELTGKKLEVMVYGDGAFKDPVGKIWELADPVVAPAYTKGLEGSPNELKLKYLSENKFKNLSGEELNEAMRKEIKNKDKDLRGKMSSQGTTPRRYTDLIGSLCDLTSGSGDKGTPVVLVQRYFTNYSE